MVEYILYESFFPRFFPVTIDVKKRIDQYTTRFPPSSDFNFFGVLSYDVSNRAKYSFLNGNLVLLLEEYTDEGMFLSFLGCFNIANTAERLLEYAKQQGLPMFLKLLPECNFTDESKKQLSKLFVLTEDEDNFDYVLSVEDLTFLKGPALHQKKKTLSKFFQTYKEAHAIVCSVTEHGIGEKLFGVFEKWEVSRQGGEVNMHEIQAMKRTVHYAEYFDLHVLFARDKNEIIGYTIFEFVQDGYVISAFQKADRNYFGVFEFMNHSLATYVKNYGISWINIEQDLGIPGLRQAKKKYNPRFYKKYTLSYR